MKKLLTTSLLFAISIISLAQSGIQRLEKIGGLNAYVWYPNGYDTAKVKKYPLIVFLPGQGETGTDASKLFTYGPAGYIRDGKLKPNAIVISLQPTTQWPDENIVNTGLTNILKTYKVDTGSIHLTGISSGGNAIERFGLTPSMAIKVRSIVPVAATEASALWGNVPTIAKLRLRWCFLMGLKDSQFGKQFELHARITWVDFYKSTFHTPNNNGHTNFEVFYNPAFKMPGTDMNMYEWMILGQLNPGEINPPKPEEMMWCVGSANEIKKIVVLFKDGKYKEVDSSQVLIPTLMFDIK